jgi:carbamate kinase
MGPKAMAAARFATGQGGFAAIGALSDASAILDGRSGTRVVGDGAGTVVSFDLHQATR